MGYAQLISFCFPTIYPYFFRLSKENRCNYENDIRIGAIFLFTNNYFTGTKENATL